MRSGLGDVGPNLPEAMEVDVVTNSEADKRLHYSRRQIVTPTFPYGPARHMASLPMYTHNIDPIDQILNSIRHVLMYQICCI